MGKYWKSLGPVWQHLHLFVIAAVGVLLVPLMSGARPSESEYLMAIGAGLAACCGLRLPPPAPR